MNYLAIDYGTKKIGLAYSVSGIITPLKTLPNDDQIFDKLTKLSKELDIGKIYVGVSEGRVAKLTQKFVSKLSIMLELPIETVEESASTIEADQIYKNNGHQKNNYKKNIDSIAAAVILRRVIN